MPNGMDYSLKNRIIDGTGMILDTEPGTPDEGTYVTENQLADWIKEKILFTGYYHNGNFYSDSGHTTLLAKVNGALYIDQTNANKALYVCLSSSYQSLTEEAQVQAILDGLNDGTIVPLKAKQDQNGNVIDQTYETKADASDLKDAIDNNSQRIENLEVAVSGSLVQTNVLTDPPSMANVRTITNANEILPWAILKRVGARATQFNQIALVPSSVSGITFTVDSTGLIHGTGTANATTLIRLSSNLVNGHKYFVNAYYGADGTDNRNISSDDISLPATTGYTISTSGHDGFFVYKYVISGNAYDFYYRLNIHDITLMNEASLTADQFRAKFPASYYPYNTGEIIPLNPSAFKVVGKNKWDEETEVGSLYFTDGTKNDTVTNALRSKNYIIVCPDTSYYLIDPTNARSLRFCYYSEDGTFISASSWVGGITGYLTITTPPSCTKMLMAIDSAYGTTYNHNIMICLNSVTDKTYEEYKENSIPTSQISDGHYINENCYDYVENVIEDGIVKGKKHSVVGEVVITESNITDPTDNGNRAIFNVAILNPRKYSSPADVPNMLMAGFVAVSQNTTWSAGHISMSTTSSNSVYVIMPTGTTKADMLAQHGGDKIYYELESESITDCDPIQNIPCEDGTTVQAVTPQTDLVNSIDVPSTIAYMTKISS